MSYSMVNGFTAPTKEDAINLFVAEYLDVRFVRTEEEPELDTLRRQKY